MLARLPRAAGAIAIRLECVCTTAVVQTRIFSVQKPSRDAETTPKAQRGAGDTRGSLVTLGAAPGKQLGGTSAAFRLVTRVPAREQGCTLPRFPQLSASAHWL